MNKIKVIAVDFDGTLVESNAIKDNAFEYIFSKWPEHKDKMMRWHLADNTTIRNEKFRYFVEDVLRLQGDDKLIEKLTIIFSELCFKEIVSCPMVDGVLEFLDAYKSKVQLFLVSATPSEELRKIVKLRKLSRYFKEIIGAPINKVEVLKNILSVNRISADEMLYIGDSPEDQEIAKTLGCNFIGRKSCRELNSLTIPVYPDFVKIKEYIDRRYVI